MKVAQSCPILCDLMDYTVHGILQARILEWVAFPSPGDLPNPGIKPRSPTLQADSLPAEPKGKPKNTRVGSLSLFQGIFPIQESKQGLLHCRWILNQLSYLGSLDIHYYIWIRSPRAYCTTQGIRLRILEWHYRVKESKQEYVYVGGGGCVCVTESLCCTPGTNTVNQLYFK